MQVNKFVIVLTNIYLLSFYHDISIAHSTLPSSGCMRVCLNPFSAILIKLSIMTFLSILCFFFFNLARIFDTSFFKFFFGLSFVDYVIFDVGYTRWHQNNILFNIQCCYFLAFFSDDTLPGKSSIEWWKCCCELGGYGKKNYCDLGWYCKLFLCTW